MTVLDTYRAAGFSSDEIGQYMAAERAKLRAAGFNDNEIAAELGVGTFDEGAVRSYFDTQSAARAGGALYDGGPPRKSGLNAAIEGAADSLGLSPERAARVGEIADNIAVAVRGGFEAADLGFQQSVTGLVARGRLPDQPSHDFNTFERVMFQMGAMTGDLPAMVAGGAVGAGAGPMSAVTIPAGAFALPAGMRRVLMESYAKGETRSFGDFLDRSLGVAADTIKGGVTGAAVGRAGQVVQGAARLPAEILTLVSVGSGLEGRIPEPEEFVDAAIVIGGLHFAVSGAQRLRDIYAQTGRRPSEVMRDIDENPAIGTDLQDPARQIPRAYEAEARQQTEIMPAGLDKGIEGLRAALADQGKLEELQKARPEIRGVGDVQAKLEGLQSEKARVEGRPFDEARAQETVARVGELPGITEPRFTREINDKVANAAEELLVAGDVIRDPHRLISDQIMELLQTNRITGADFANVLERHGLTREEFADVWRVNVRKAARDLQALSAVEAKVRALTNEASPEDAAILRQAGMDQDAQAKGLWRRLDDVRRGLLVTQISTAVRNLETQVARVGVDVLQKGLDAGLQRLLPDAARTVHPADGFAAILRMFQHDRTRTTADEILGRFPKEADDLFMRYSSDINRAGAGTDAMAKAERAVEVLNIANRFQEYALRRAVFVTSLEQRLRAQGQDLEAIISGNQIGKIAREDIQTAVTAALDMTWAKSFDPFAKGPEGVAGKFVAFVNSMPGIATIAVPFPRFLMNAIKFQFEFSPMGLLKLLSSEERARVAGGDTATISRAIIGTGLLLAAYQFRGSDYAGERWWELRTPGGGTVDLRPYNPFGSYLFVADVVKRLRDGTLNSLTSKDVALGVLSSNLRAGAGLFVVDSMIEGLIGIGNEEKALDAIKGIAGEVLSGFLVPVQQLRDVFADLDKWLGSGQEAVLRDTRDARFLGPFATKIPGAARSFPEVESPTRAAPPRRVMPTVRQITGLGFNEPKNPAERELDRLGFTRGEILPSTGVPEADRLIAKHMGPLVEAAVVPLVQTPYYQEFSNEVKGGVLRDAMLGARRIAMDNARAENPALFAKIKVEAMPRRQRLMLESLIGQPLGEMIQGGR